MTARLLCALLIIFGLIIIVGGLKCAIDADKTKRYFGPVIEKGKEEASIGFRKHDTHYIIIKDIECKKNVRVHLEFTKWDSCKVNDTLAFRLSGQDLNNYENQNGYKHLK